MSKIGRENFGLQEQAEELGFESVQEALDNDYFAILEKDGKSRLIPKMEWEMKKAHEEWLAKKKIVVDKLIMLMHDTQYQAYKDVIKETIDFIEGGEV